MTEMNQEFSFKCLKFELKATVNGFNAPLLLLLEIQVIWQLFRPCIDDSADVLDGFFTGAYDCLD